MCTPYVTKHDFRLPTCCLVATYSYAFNIHFSLVILAISCISTIYIVIDLCVLYSLFNNNNYVAMVQFTVQGNVR